MVNINNLSFRYGKKEVLSNISLNLEAGKMYGLLGENGVGKTTLLKIMAGLQRPYAGNCTVNGEKPGKRTPSFLSKLYFLPEELEYIRIAYSPEDFAKLYAPFYPQFDNDKFRQILNEFDVDSKQKLHNMSQGQAKKAGIAFAIACNPELLLMDEPSNGLDIPSKSLFRQIMSRYVSDNTCTVISTHQVRDLENLINPIIILDNKAVLMNASLEEISDILYFSLQPIVPADALYAEPSLGGYLCVSINKGQGESRINLEALFNATMRHKQQIMNLFNNK